MAIASIAHRVTAPPRAATPPAAWPLETSCRPRRRPRRSLPVPHRLPMARRRRPRPRSPAAGVTQGADHSVPDACVAGACVSQLRRSPSGGCSAHNVCTVLQPPVIQHGGVAHDPQAEQRRAAERGGGGDHVAADAVRLVREGDAQHVLTTPRVGAHCAWTTSARRPGCGWQRAGLR
eukprot:scaffold104193_cov63-Phaeocystis_antarctica.AAC.4